jgi:DNA-binding transcriptional LysR family regulator
MRFEQLEYIAAVTQHGSLRRASEQLHISQPALSESVSRLERELGVTLLDRRRSGARISRQGQDLLPQIIEVIEAVHRLRTAAGDQVSASRLVRVGTTNAATANLLLPALRAVQTTHPATTIEIIDAMQTDIQIGLEEGALDLGLANLLSGDDFPISLRSTPLLRGRPVLVLPPTHALAAKQAVTADDLRGERFVLMRSGYAMRRYAHRLFGEQLPSFQTTDGAEMGKLMVSEGVGLTLLPDYSVAGDPLERSGLVTYRPIVGDRTSVTMIMLQRRGQKPSHQAQALAAALVEQAEAWSLAPAQ